MPRILEDAQNQLTPFSRELLLDLYHQLMDLDTMVREYDQRIVKEFKKSPACQKLAQIAGVGPLTATAVIASVGDASSFKNGRQLSAWLGLVPRQHSSGDKKRLLGISKRGNSYLRGLLIHGARAVIRHSNGKDDPASRWLNGVKDRRGTNRATVALANKNARAIWRLLNDFTATQTV